MNINKRLRLNFSFNGRMLKLNDSVYLVHRPFNKCRRTLQ